MRTLIQAFLAILLACGLIGGALYQLNHETGAAGADTLTVYNWGEYIDPDLLKKFENETGMKVVLETFDSNEAMLTKIEQGGTTYDVTVPSEYMIDKMRKEDLLIPLDYNQLPNSKHLDKRFLDKPYDPKNKYSIPYFWGTVGIVYNKNMFPNQDFSSWSALWDDDLRNELILIDSAREVMGMGLNALGYSLNDTNDRHLREAKNHLDELMPNVKAIVGDEARILLANNEAGIGLSWSGVASELLDENEDLEFVIPKEGSNLWFDNMVIPKTAKNIEGAHAFINFMLNPKNAAQNAEYVAYATPNKTALKYLPKEITSDARFYPPTELTDKLEVYENLGIEKLARYNELFLQFKMATK